MNSWLASHQVAKREFNERNKTRGGKGEDVSTEWKLVCLFESKRGFFFYKKVATSFVS